MMKFRGRVSELTALQNKYNTDGFQMVILYGRRRIGKTELMNEFMSRQSCMRVSFTSTQQSEKELLSIMTETVLRSLAPEMLDMITFPDFERLFEFVGSRAEKEKIIFFIDEYPYLAKQCPYIQSVLQKVIDTSWKKTNLYFVLCGSLVSFMKDEVLSESAPLHGRSTLEINLLPFNYLETADFLDGYSLEEKAIVYGLTGGVAKYIEQFNMKKSLYENIISEYFDPNGYFTEEQIKTVVSGDKQNPALYSSIVSAIATGHTHNSEIASYVGIDDISYALKVLINAEIIEKRISKKPYYVLNDSMLEFWYRYVGRAISLINSGNGRRYFNEQVVDKLHDFMGAVFEKICKEYLFMNAGKGRIPLITEIDNYQQSVKDDKGHPVQLEIDILGKIGKDVLLIGECKFRNEKVDKSVYEDFLRKAAVINSGKATLCMFSLSGYTEYIKKNAGEVMLLSMRDIYKN